MKQIHCYIYNFFPEKSGKNEGRGVKLQVVSGLPVRVMLF